MYHPRVVYFFFTQAHPTAILCFSMRLLSFFCSAVSSLSFSMGFALVGIAAFITAVCLSPKTTSANAKNLTTPTTSDFQRHYRFNRSDNSISGVAYNPDDVVRINECVGFRVVHGNCIGSPKFLPSGFFLFSANMDLYNWAGGPMWFFEN